MSLRETIDGARREAQQTVSDLSKKEQPVEKSEHEKKGFSRKSAAKAKPAREAASSVRITSKPKKSSFGGGPAETKEQKKQRKRKEREEDDLRNRAYDLILRDIPGYRKSEKIFFVLIGLGFGLALLALLVGYVFKSMDDYSTPTGMAYIGLLVFGYVFIIVAFIYDLVKRRPFRREAEQRVRGLTDKKIVDLFEKTRAAQQKEQAAKDANKAKRKK